jgi:hypothetical protein
MRWSDFGSVLRERRVRSSFILWLTANLGGILISTLAFITVWFFHRTGFGLLPNINVFLVTAAIALAVSGVSYIRLTFDNKAYSLSPALAVTWPFLLAAVFGIFLVLGVKTPVVSKCAVWIVTVVVFLVIMAWSSIMYLNEQGLRLETEKPPEIPVTSADYKESLPSLPKLAASEKKNGEE